MMYSLACVVLFAARMSVAGPPISPPAPPAQLIESDTVKFKSAPKYDAVLQTACDDYGSMFRSDDGGKTVANIVTENQQNRWDITYTYDLKDVTKNTIIKIRCRNGGGPGGFIAAMTVNGNTYVTTNPINSGNWKAYRPFLKGQSKKLSDLTYTNQGTTWASGVTGPIDSSAVYTNVPEYSSLEFYFRFRSVLRKKKGKKNPKLAEEEEEENDEEEEEEYFELIPFDVETERQAMRDAGVAEEEIMMYSVPEEEMLVAMSGVGVDAESQQISSAMYATGASMMVLLAFGMVYQCRKQNEKKMTPLMATTSYQSV